MLYALHIPHQSVFSIASLWKGVSMNRTVIERASVLVLVLAICAAFAVPALATETINMRSGGGYAFGAIDPAWQYTLGPVSAPQQATPFTAADFNAVFSGPNAVVVAPYGSFWLA
ncbi:MAG TPA: hypothetical protein VFH33_03455, partial [Candidatus Krumholzibacteria bacterium]|nr:hypothetical protein [Candidatus Krumholzibacteria bacterium]